MKLYDMENPFGQLRSAIPPKTYNLLTAGGKGREAEKTAKALTTQF